MRVLMYGGAGGSGGYVRYCRGLLCSRAIEADVEVVFVASEQLASTIDDPDPGVQIVANPSVAHPARYRRIFWHLCRYPTLRHQFRPDIEFFPLGVLPWISGLRAGPSVRATACHNLLPFDRRELERYRGTELYGKLVRLKRRLGRTYRHVDGVIFFSAHSREMAVQDLGEIPDPVVIPHGLDRVDPQAVDRSYELGSPIRIVYPSTIWLYKNHDVVVQAVARLRRTSGLDLRLVLLGGGEPYALEQLDNTIRECEAASFVEHLGNRSHPEVLAELRRSDMLLFASSCETFGISLLEGMGAGLPIASSNRSGLPDLLGEAGIYFDPRHVEEMAAAIASVLGSLERRRRLGRQALERAAEFSWERSARRTFQYFRTLSQR